MNLKRGQNQGSIYQRSSDQRWVAQVTDAGKHKLAYFHSQAEAQRWLTFALVQIRLNRPISTRQTPLSVYFEFWLEHMALTLRPKTLLQYRQTIQNHLLPGLGNVSIQELSTEQLQSFYTLKAKTGTSQRTMQLINSILHHALEDAVQSGLVLVNPVKGTLKMRRNSQERIVLDPLQVQQLIEASQGSRWGVLICLAVTTGMREGEIMGLKWADIHWDLGQLQIQRQLYRLPGKGLVFHPPKTTTSRRNVALGERMLALLRAHAQRQAGEKSKAGSKWEENDLVFPTITGKPMDPRQAYDYYKEIIRELGLPNLRFHDLRHTAASLMLAWGINPKVAQERLGHAHVSYTLGTYSHVLPTFQKEAAQRMDQLIPKTGDKG
jgi:integrase